MKKSNILKALEEIEELVGSDFAQDVEWGLFRGKYSGDAKKMAEMIGRIYTIAHGWNPTHPCYKVHKDWRKTSKKK